MRLSSNFKDTYEAIIKACGDIHGLESTQCRTTRAALQAVEIDQQPAGTQAGPVCSRKPAKTPECAGGVPEPTATGGVVPTSTPQPTTTSSPTVVPTNGGSSVVKIDFKNSCVGDTSDAADKSGYTKAEFSCRDGRSGGVGNGVECMSETELRRRAEAVCGGTIGTPTTTPPPTTAATPTAEPTVSSSPTSTEVSVRLRVKLQGVFGAPRRLTTVSVKLALKDEQSGFIAEKLILISAKSDGTWEGTQSVDIPKGQYVALVKGPMHIQKKICHASPSEPIAGNYRCSGSKITIADGENLLDFTGVVLLVGDLPDQDGVVNSYDISLVRNNIGATASQVTQYCDVNYDGVCNSQDYSILIAALKVRVDEE